MFFKNKEQKWKVIAIVFITLFIFQNLFIVFSFMSVSAEERQIKECFYEICEDYLDADLVDDICYCYDYDVLGELYVAKEKWMK